MRLSRYLLPLLKEKPAEAQVISHQYMLRAGMIKQVAAGLYNWLPLGHKVLQKIEHIVRDEMNKAGAIELLMPILQPAELWQESGRYDAYGKEMLRMQDRHDRPLLYGPTAEEVVTDIFRSAVKSYKDLPLNLYQIQWKFRDEIRPRFGVMRGREFYLKDAYSFDLDEASAVESYNIMYTAYLKTFKRMGLTAIPVRAVTGAIGGSLSHEFQILAETGESDVYYDKAFEALMENPELDLDALHACYAAADELHDPKNCPVAEADLRCRRGIEVGHIFNFGTKYSEPMKAVVTNNEGKEVPVQMGSYGIGVSRLAGAIIESSHDEKGIIWPTKEVAPFHVALLNLKVNDEACLAASDNIYAQLQATGAEVLYDDRKESAGSKFATQDLIGTPWQIAVGPRGVQQGTVELKSRATGEKEEVSIESALARIHAYMAS